MVGATPPDKEVVTLGVGLGDATNASHGEAICNKNTEKVISLVLIK